MSRSPSADGPANSVWRYGVYLFPLAPLSVLVGYASILLLGLGTETESVGVLAVARLDRGDRLEFRGELVDRPVFVGNRLV